MSKISRRQFTAASAAVASTFAIRKSSAAQASNDKIGLAVIGCGGRGGSHIGAFTGMKNAEILYLVDADDAAGARRAADVEKRTGTKPKVVTDMRVALDDPSVDAVSTATPNHWHALCGVWAMQAGKDAYIEKPICHNVMEGRALVEAAKKYKRMCQVGTQCRSHKAIHDGIKFMNEGNIGEVNFARGLCYKRRRSIGPKGDYPIPAGVDFNLWSGPASMTTPKITRGKFHYDWHWQRHYGNGDLGNQGPHQTDIARWGLGLMRHPNTITCYGGRLGYQAERKDDNYVDAGDAGNTEVSIYDYGDKCIVFETRGLEIKASADDEINRLFGEMKDVDGTEKWVPATRGNKIGVIFYGTEGYLVQRSYTHCVAFDKSFNVIKEFKGGGDHFGNYVEACNTRNAEDLNASALEGHLSAAISHLGNISYYVGEQNHVSVDEAAGILSDIKSLDDNGATLNRTVQHLKDSGVDLEKYPLSMGPKLEFDPEKEVFTNNDDANAWLTRDYRSGFECPKPADV